MDKNYLTPLGYRRLEAELRYLKREERPQVTETVSWAAGNGDRSENGDYIYGKKRLREIDRRIRFLSKQLESAEVIDPTTLAGTEDIRFGATVRVVNEEGVEKVFQIVGVEETDAAAGRISWRSPIAKALFRKGVDDVAIVQAPSGEKEYEIIEVLYQAIDIPQDFRRSTESAFQKK